MYEISAKIPHLDQSNIKDKTLVHPKGSQLLAVMSIFHKLLFPAFVFVICTQICTQDKETLLNVALKSLPSARLTFCFDYDTADALGSVAIYHLCDKTQLKLNSVGNREDAEEQKCE